MSRLWRLMIAWIALITAVPSLVAQITHASAAAPAQTVNPDAQKAWLRQELARSKGESRAAMKDDLEAAKHPLFSDNYDNLLELLTPLLESSAEKEGALRILLALRLTDWAKDTLAEQRLNELTLSLAPALMDHGDAASQALLAQALGAMTTEQSRALLLTMVQRKLAYGQSLLCLTEIGEARDLPRLATILSNDDPADPDGRVRSRICEVLRSSYGQIAMPFLSSIAQQAKQERIRASCAKQVMAANGK